MKKEKGEMKNLEKESEEYTPEENAEFSEFIKKGSHTTDDGEKIEAEMTPEQQYMEDYEDKFHKSDKNPPNENEEIIEETFEW